ncbi:MAG: hypothetical protein JWO77_1171 [Ilumatobacteraceae bacterium]|nr:hypothetical protein [Ilumatobacteraceae bacterium]
MSDLRWSSRGLSLAVSAGCHESAERVVRPSVNSTSSIVQRAVLAYLTFAGLLVGVWAAIFPRSFADDFPGFGRVWVAVDGPFNEHLVRDVGQLSLALAVVSLVAAVTMQPILVRVAAAAWLVNAVPHLVYHLRHLGPLEPFDQVGEIVSLSLLVVLPVVVLWCSYRDGRSVD